MIEDTTIDEKVRSVVGPKLVFYKNYNLLMYLKFALTVSERIVKEIEDASDSNSSSFSEKEDNLLDIEKDVPKKNFHWVLVSITLKC